jgi:hypothetical protein
VTKNGRTLTFPLSPKARELLGAVPRYKDVADVFPALRQVVVEKLFNHVSGGTQSPIAQVYNRYSYLDEMGGCVAVGRPNR